MSVGSTALYVKNWAIHNIDKAKSSTYIQHRNWLLKLSTHCDDKQAS